MSISKEVGHIVLDGDPVGTQRPPQQLFPIFGPCLLWSNGRHLSNCWALVTFYQQTDQNEKPTSYI